MSQYNVPDKSAGETWTSAEHNMLKFAVNDNDDRIGQSITDIAAAEVDISNNAAGIAAQDAAIAANTLANAQQATDIDIVESGVSANAGAITTLNTSQAAQDSAIAGLTASQAAQDTAIAGNTSTSTANAAAAAANAASSATNAGNIATNAQAAADALDRANHTGTQTLSTISDAGTAASRDVPANPGDQAAAGEVVLGDDPRLNSTGITPAQAAAIAANTASNAAQDNSISTLETSQGAQDSAISTLQTSQAAQDASIADLETEQGVQDGAIAANAVSISALETEQTTQNDDINALEAEQVTQDAAISANTTAISNLGTASTHDVPVTAGSQASATQVVRGDDPRLANTGGGTMGATAAEAAAIMSNTADIATIEGEQLVQNGNITNNANAITQAETNISTIQSAISSNDSDIASLNTDVAQNEADIAALGTSSVLDVPAAAGDEASATEVVRGDDPRLIDDDSVTFTDFNTDTSTDGSDQVFWRYGNGQPSATLSIDSENHEPGQTIYVSNQALSSDADLTLTMLGAGNIQNGNEVVPSLPIAPGETYTLVRNAGNNWTVVGFYTRMSDSFDVDLVVDFGTRREQYGALTNQIVGAPATDVRGSTTHGASGLIVTTSAHAVTFQRPFAAPPRIESITIGGNDGGASSITNARFELGTVTTTGFVILVSDFNGTAGVRLDWKATGLIP